MRVFKDGKLIDEDSEVSPTNETSPIGTPKYIPGAHNSQIKSVDEDISDGKKTLVTFIQDIKNQREEIDKLNQSMTFLAGKMSEIGQIIDKQSAILNQLSGNTQNTPTAAAPTQGMDLEKLGTLFEAAGPLIERVWPKADTQTSLIDQNTINKKMVDTFMDNIETGESINNFIKNALKKNVTKEVINSSLKDIGKDVVNHGPA